MKPGYKLGSRYQIIRPLGEGGMANVYLARDLVLDREVSVKLLRLDLRDDPQTKRRFQREAMAATRLNDPHIVGIYDVGEDHGMQFMVMQYVKGTDLKQYISKHFPIPLAQVVDIMEQVLSAVEAAHEHGIIHRDLKPQNILIDENKNVKITDFGIATASSENTLTQTNTVMGSVHYLSPEQARGSVATKRSDIYSLGIILFELLTGKVPFEGENAVSIAIKHFRAQIPSVRSINPEIPQALENVVIKATAKDPQQRYESAAEMAADLKTALDPSRANEKPLIINDHDNDETKVLDVKDMYKQVQQPDTDAEDQSSNDDSQENSDKDDSQEGQKEPQHRHIKKRWLIGTAAGLIVLAGGAGYYFNRPIMVPNIENQTAVQAQKTLSKKHLRLGNITRAHSRTVAKGKIIRTSSPDKRKFGQEVNVVVSDGVSSWKMADYVGNDYESTASDLRDRGFTVKKKEKYSDSAEKGEILKQNISAGSTVSPSAKPVVLTVSAGKKTVKIPNFKNKDLSDVQSFANEHHLQLTVTDKHSDSVPTNHVIKQTPKKGSKLNEGDTLTVQVASSGNQTRTTNIQINIPFDGNGGKKENRVQVYILDANHNLTMEYQDITINQETTINVPFTLKQHQYGAYKVIRNGRTIMSATNITG